MSVELSKTSKPFGERSFVVKTVFNLRRKKGVKKLLEKCFLKEKKKVKQVLGEEKMLFG